MKKLLGLIWLAAVTPVALAALPPPDEAARAKAEAAAARQAWSQKVDAYKLCEAQDRVAAGYFTAAEAAGKPVKPGMPTPPCTDPGPFSAAATGDKPLETSGAHSPAPTAASPPSERETEAQGAGASPADRQPAAAPASSEPSADEKPAVPSKEQTPAAPGAPDAK